MDTIEQSADSRLFLADCNNNCDNDIEYVDGCECAHCDDAPDLVLLWQNKLMKLINKLVKTIS